MFCPLPGAGPVPVSSERSSAVFPAALNTGSAERARSASKYSEDAASKYSDDFQRKHFVFQLGTQVHIPRPTYSGTPPERFRIELAEFLQQGPQLSDQEQLEAASSGHGSSTAVPTGSDVSEVGAEEAARSSPRSVAEVSRQQQAKNDDERDTDHNRIVQKLLEPLGRRGRRMDLQEEEYRPMICVEYYP